MAAYATRCDDWRLVSRVASHEYNFGHTSHRPMKIVCRIRLILVETIVSYVKLRSVNVRLISARACTCTYVWWSGNTFLRFCRILTGYSYYDRPIAITSQQIILPIEVIKIVVERNGLSCPDVPLKTTRWLPHWMWLHYCCNSLPSCW